MYDLIFSDERGQRIKRHLLFWTAFYIYQVVRVSFLFPTAHVWESVPVILISSFTWGLIHNLFFTYTTTYYLVPKFFIKRKYVLFALGILISFIIMYSYSFLRNSISPKITKAIGSTKEQPYLYNRGVIIRMFGNAPLVCGLFVALNALRNWHSKQLENEQLKRENTNAELQLLKAQIHPHFLFNTLNNIYSFTLTKSPLAAELVQKLSDMLNYMITDCDRMMVPVDKEIQLLNDYVALEKVRYGDRLDIQMHVNGDSKNCMIAPLLMIPFVENSFKHGASLMRGNKWMHLVININYNELEFNISNSKPSQSNSNATKNGIGLLNVQRRLGLLYPDKHHLKINSTDNTFSVYLEIELQKQLVPIRKEINQRGSNSSAIEDLSKRNEVTQLSLPNENI